VTRAGATASVGVPADVVISADLMILPQLLQRFAAHRDDEEFYRLQAADALRWLESRGVRLGDACRALDLGCGHGVFGECLRLRGCAVTFADEQNFVVPRLKSQPFLPVNLDQDNLAQLGQYDLVVCSNVLEHLSNPNRFLASAQQLLVPGGHLYLSWTNWLSPWGGHEFSPWHYLGPRWGPKIYDLYGAKRFHQPGRNLFVTSIGGVLRQIARNPHLSVVGKAPRYYTEAAGLMSIPLLREFLAWNCALLIQRIDPRP